jgi:hypothetical protein
VLCCGQVLVWKEINYSHMRPVEKQRIADEVNILKELRNPFIVRFYDHIHERASKRCYIVMEHCPVRAGLPVLFACLPAGLGGCLGVAWALAAWLCSCCGWAAAVLTPCLPIVPPSMHACTQCTQCTQGGDLRRLIKTCRREGRWIEESFIWRVLAQLIVALKDCHRRARPILHRDIKPANVLLDQVPARAPTCAPASVCVPLPLSLPLPSPLPLSLVILLNPTHPLPLPLSSSPPSGPQHQAGRLWAGQGARERVRCVLSSWAGLDWAGLGCRSALSRARSLSALAIFRGRLTHSLTHSLTISPQTWRRPTWARRTT